MDNRPDASVRSARSRAGRNGGGFPFMRPPSGIRKTKKKHTVPGSGARTRLEKVTGAHCDTGMEQGLMFPHSVGLKLCSAACFVQNAHLSSALQDTLMMLCV